MGSQIFVWVGKGSTQQEKQSSLQYATQFLANSGRPDWTPITRVVEGGEANNFKSQFSNWSDVSNPYLFLLLLIIIIVIIIIGFDKS